MRTLRLGAKGSDVKLWQMFLHSGASYQGPLDGDFGKATVEATQAFQRAHALVDDGVVGNRTWGVAMQFGLELVPDDEPAVDPSPNRAGPAPTIGAWIPPAPPTTPLQVVTIDPRIITAHSIGQLPCPSNPPAPIGWAYWQGGVSPALSAFASSVEFRPADFAMGSFVQAVIAQQLVAARVEWHDFQGATGARGCFRGTSLFRPLRPFAPLAPA
ncbi:MAG TPA: peptidoglycan-binding domain-containing protein [Polyangiaceae bacterium]|jgi:hypothetical protein